MYGNNWHGILCIERGLSFSYIPTTRIFFYITLILYSQTSTGDTLQSYPIFQVREPSDCLHFKSSANPALLPIDLYQEINNAHYHTLPFRTSDDDEA